MDSPLPQTGSQLDFRRWAVLGVVAPVAVFLAAYYFVLPWLFGEATASELGDKAGLIFIGWFGVVILAAAVRTLWGRRKQ